MKKGWQTKRIGDIAQHSLGKMLDKAKNRGEPKPYLRNLNVRWGEFDLSDLLEMRFLPEEAEKFTAVKGDVLVCEGGYPGRAAIWDRDEPIYFQKALHRVRFHETERNRWFVHYLQFRDLEGTLRNHFNGAGIQHFTGEALARFEIPLPPLTEQQRIVGVLDEAFAGLAAAQANTARNLQNARALFESHLQSVFTQRGKGWVEKRLEESFRLKSGDGLISEAMKGGRYAVYGGNGIAGMHDEFNLSGGNVIIGRVGALCGNARHITEKIWLTDNAFKVVDRRFEFDGTFLTYLLNFKDLRSFARQAAQPVISNSSLKDVLLAFPEIDEQRRIVTQLDALSAETQRLATIYEQKQAALAALKKSLLHQAFTGEL